MILILIMITVVILAVAILVLVGLGCATGHPGRREAGGERARSLAGLGRPSATSPEKGPGGSLTAAGTGHYTKWSPLSRLGFCAVRPVYACTDARTGMPVIIALLPPPHWYPPFGCPARGVLTGHLGRREAGGERAACSQDSGALVPPVQAKDWRQPDGGVTTHYAQQMYEELSCQLHSELRGILALRSTAQVRECA